MRRDIAVKAQEQEKEQREKAEALAETERRLKEAARQANIAAERRRKEAVFQEIIARVNAMMADEQRIVALEQEEKARQAEQKAVAAAKAEAIARKDAEEAAEAAFYEEIVARLNEAKAQEQEQIAQAETQKAIEAQAKEKEQREEAQRQERIAKVEKQKAVDAQAEEKKQRENAQRQERIAKDAAEAAFYEEIIARLNEAKAQEQQRIAREQEQKAKEQEQIAKEQEQKAKEQEQKAIAAAASEKIQRLLAEEATRQVKREAYNSKIGLAAAKIEENAFDYAREVLDSTAKEFRNWEWGYLKRLCEQFERQYKFKGHRLESVALIDGGKQFVVGGEGLVEIHDIDDSDGRDPRALALHNVALRNTERKLKPDQLRPNVTVYDVAVSPDGWIVLATDDYEKGFIKLWDPKQNELLEGKFGDRDIFYRSEDEYYEKLKSRHMDPVVSVQFSQDGKKLLTSSKDRTARVWAWNAESGDPQVRPLTVLAGHTDIVWDAVFGKGETQVVTVSEDRTAIVWRDETGHWQDPKNIKRLPAFRGHQSAIYTVAFSPEGQYVATGDYDRRVLLWRPSDIPQLDYQTYIRMSIAGESIPPRRTANFWDILRRFPPSSSAGRPAKTPATWCC